MERQKLPDKQAKPEERKGLALPATPRVCATEQAKAAGKQDVVSTMPVKRCHSSTFTIWQRESLKTQVKDDCSNTQRLAIHDLESQTKLCSGVTD